MVIITIVRHCHKNAFHPQSGKGIVVLLHLIHVLMAPTFRMVIVILIFLAKITKSGMLP